MDFPNMPSRKVSNELQTLKSRHNEILRRTALGQSRKDIAADLGVTTQTVSNTTGSQLGQVKLAELNGDKDLETIDITREIKALVPEAVKLLHSTIEGHVPDHPTKVTNVNPGLRVKAATELMDRAGFGKISKVEGRFDHGYAGEVGLRVMKDRAREIGLLDDNPRVEIDAEATEVVSEEVANG